jgi:hypothetical protein
LAGIGRPAGIVGTIWAQSGRAGNGREKWGCGPVDCGWSTNGQHTASGAGPGSARHLMGHARVPRLDGAPGQPQLLGHRLEGRRFGLGLLKLLPYPLAGQVWTDASVGHCYPLGLPLGGAMSLDASRHREGAHG